MRFVLVSDDPSLQRSSRKEVERGSHIIGVRRRAYTTGRRFGEKDSDVGKDHARERKDDFRAERSDRSAKEGYKLNTGMT